MADQWLSIVEYARTFGISDMTIRRRIRTGKLEAQLRDGKYFIPVGGHVSSSNSSRSAPRTRGAPIDQTLSNQPTNNQRPIVASHRASSQPSHQHQGSVRGSNVDANPYQSIEYDPYQNHLDSRSMPTNGYRSSYEETPSNGRQRRDEDQRLDGKTLSRQIEVIKPTHITPDISLEEYADFPRAMIQEINETATETREVAGKILSFAKTSIQQAKELELVQRKLSETKIQVFVERLTQKDQTISSLRQQIEDLQLLVQILEKKKA